MIDVEKARAALGLAEDLRVRLLSKVEALAKAKATTA